jgi:hypothetical protein
MTTPQAQILVTNLTQGNMSIDIRDDKFSQKVLRATLAPASTPPGVKPTAFVDAASFGWTLQELQTNAQMQNYLNHKDPITGLLSPQVAVTVVRGTQDIAGAINQSADAHGEVVDDIVELTFAAGAGGAPADIILYNANFPYSAEISDVQVQIKTAVAASTAQLRSATGGLGSVLSDLFTTATTGRKRDTGTALLGVAPQVPVNGTIVLRLSDSGLAGTVRVDFKRLA